LWCKWRNSWSAIRFFYTIGTSATNSCYGKGASAISCSLILHLGDHFSYTLSSFHASPFLFMLECKWGSLKGQFGMSQKNFGGL
jgi:hypothetical protein